MKFQLNDIELDTKQYQIVQSGQALTVEPKVFDTIVYLILHRDRLVTRDELFEQVWNGRLVSDTSLSNHIKSARKIFSDDGDKQQVIKTVRGRGYQFVGNIELVDEHCDSTAQNQNQSHANPNNQVSKLGKLWLPVVATLILVALFIVLKPGGEYGQERVSENGAPKIDLPYLLVVPINVISNDSSSLEPFGDQMTREIIQNLRKISGIRVVPPPSAFTFKGNKSRELIARKLPAVRYVLDGALMDDGNGRTRMTLELEELQSGDLVWDGDFDIEMANANPFSLQADIAASVSGSLEVVVLDAEKRQLAEVPTSSVEAYELYVQGQYQLSLMSHDSVLKAIELFSAAVELDPKFEDAIISRSDAYRVIMVLFDSPKDNLPKVISSAIDVLDVNPESARARSSLGVAYVHTWLWDEAWKMLSEAKKRDPDIALTELGFALYYSALGEVELMKAALARADELDPLNEELAEWGLWALMMANELEAARVWGEKKMKLHPNAPYPLLSMSVLEYISGNLTRSVALAEEGAELGDRAPWPLILLAQNYAASGQFEQAQATLEEAESQGGYLCPYETAVLNLYMGKHEQALDLFDQALEYRSNCLMFTRNDPRLKPIREEPRYKQLLETLGLNDDAIAGYKR